MPFEMRLHLELYLVVRHGEGDVVHDSGGEIPRALLLVRLVQQIDRALRAAVADDEAGVLALGPDLLEAEPVDEEFLLLLGVAHRHRDRVEAAHRMRRRDLVGDEALGLVVRILDQLEFKPRRMGESQRRLAEPLAGLAVLDAVLLEMPLPEGKRADRHGIAGRPHLAGALAALVADLLEREGGHHRADIGVLVGVIEVIDRLAAVIEDGLLDHPLADDLREEIDVFLRGQHAAGRVVKAGDERRQLLVLLCIGSIADRIFHSNE
jgi:hypothetical protein